MKYKINRLIQYGIIRHFTALFSVSVIGYQRYVLLLRLKKSHNNKFMRFLKSHKNITWYEQYLGKWNYVITIFSKSNKECNNIIKEMYDLFPEIVSYESVVAYDQIKFTLPFN